MREHELLARARTHFRRISDRRGAMSPTLDVRQNIEIDTEPLGVLASTRFAREEHDCRTVGDLAAVLFADAPFDHRIRDFILREAAVVELPAARLSIAIAPAVGEVDLGDARKMFRLQPKASVVFVGDIAEHARPWKACLLVFVASPHRRPADVLRGLLAGNR